MQNLCLGNRAEHIVENKNHVYDLKIEEVQEEEGKTWPRSSARKSNVWGQYNLILDADLKIRSYNSTKKIKQQQQLYNIFDLIILRSNLFFVVVVVFFASFPLNTSIGTHVRLSSSSKGNN